MRKFLIVFVAAGLAKNLPLYGVYPPAENLLMHLTGISIDKNGKRTDAEGGLTAVFQKAFKDVYENAKKSDFKNLALFGEKSKVLQCLEEYDGKYSLVKFSENVTKEEKEKGECGILWKGFFSCQLFGYNVLNHKGLEEKVEKVAKCEHTGRKGTEELVRVCKVLLSKDFARKILSDSFADAFLQHKKDACSYVNVWFYRPKREPIFCFYIAYRQYISDRFDVLFCFDYNIRECCFESSEIRVSRWFEVGTFCLQFFEKRDPYSEGLKEQPYHGTEALKYALRKLEANKRTDALLRKKKETDKTDGISEKTQRETPKQEQKLEEREAKNPKINNQHEGKSKENEEKETKVPQILSSNEEIIRNNLSEINNAVGIIRSNFNACIDACEKWKSVFSDAKYAKDKFLNDTCPLILNIQELKKELEALSMNIKKVNSDKKKRFESAFMVTQGNINKLLADIDQYRKKCKK